MSDSGREWPSEMSVQTYGPDLTSYGEYKGMKAGETDGYRVWVREEDYAALTAELREAKQECERLNKENATLRETVGRMSAPVKKAGFCLDCGFQLDSPSKIGYCYKCFRVWLESLDAARANAPQPKGAVDGKPE